jgi:hypothetical protein
MQQLVQFVDLRFTAITEYLYISMPNSGAWQSFRHNLNFFAIFCLLFQRIDSDNQTELRALQATRTTLADRQQKFVIIDFITVTVFISSSRLATMRVQPVRTSISGNISKKKRVGSSFFNGS